MDPSMKGILSQLLLGIVFFGKAWPNDICLMLSPSEKIAVSQARAQAYREAEAHNSRMLCLNGIIYTDKNSWTIWINGRSIKPGEYVDGIRILTVTPDSVTLLWTPQPHQQHQIILRPNQIFYAHYLINQSRPTPRR
jgi:hypothetical protein